MKAVKPILAALLAVALSPLNTAAEEKDEYNIYLTSKADAGVPLPEPMTTFSCQDKIYGVVEINRPEDTGQHILYATWRNPSGDDQEVTEYPFQLIDGNVRIWVWLKLHRSSGSSLFQGMNPGGGLEEFAGDWELHIRIDDQRIGKEDFELIC